MVTRTSGAQAILQCNCFHKAASTAEGAHSLPGAGPGGVAGTFMQCCPAAVKHLGCFSPTASSVHTFTLLLLRLQWHFHPESLHREVPKYPPSHPETCTTEQHKAILRQELAGRSILVRLAVSQD